MGMSIPFIRAPPVTFNSFLSFMWDVLVSKTPRRVVGTVLSVLPDVARNTQVGHQGKEGRRTLVTDTFVWISFVIIPTCCPA